MCKLTQYRGGGNDQLSLRGLLKGKISNWLNNWLKITLLPCITWIVIIIRHELSIVVVVLYYQWWASTPTTSVGCPPACQPIVPPCNQHRHLHRPGPKVPPSCQRIGKLRKKEKQERRKHVDIWPGVDTVSPPAEIAGLDPRTALPRKRHPLRFHHGDEIGVICLQFAPRSGWERCTHWRPNGQCHDKVRLFQILSLQTAICFR